MMRLRIATKRAGGRHLVKKSAMLINSVHVVDNKLTFLHKLTNEEMTPVDMLRSVVVLGVIGQLDRALVIHLQTGR